MSDEIRLGDRVRIIAPSIYATETGSICSEKKRDMDGEFFEVELNSGGTFSVTLEYLELITMTNESEQTVTGSDGKPIKVGDWVESDVHGRRKLVNGLSDRTGLLAFYGEEQLGSRKCWHRIDAVVGSDGKPICVGDWVAALNHATGERMVSHVTKIREDGWIILHWGGIGTPVEPRLWCGIDPPEERKAEPVCEACESTEGVQLFNWLEIGEAFACIRCQNYAANGGQPYDDFVNRVKHMRANREAAKPASVSDIYYDNQYKPSPSNHWLRLVSASYAEQINTGGTPGELAYHKCLVTVANEFNRLARFAVKLESQMRLVHGGFDARSEADRQNLRGRLERFTQLWESVFGA
jgi:hypothetical protein